MTADRHKKNASRRIPWLAVVGAILIVLVIVALRRPSRPQAQSSKIIDGHTLSVVTDDGITLKGTMIYPKTAGSASPLVILVHQWGASRQEWNPYVATFTAAGFAVLAYDIRGFGESTLPQIITDREKLAMAARHDMAAILKYVQGQSNIDQQKVNIIGASLGANIAYAAAVDFPSIHRVVLLSPADFGAGLAPEKTMHPVGIFGLSDDKEWPRLQMYMDTAADPKKVSIIPAGGHGIELLKSANVMSDSIHWIQS